MTTPNHAYCKEYCSGKTDGCPHYLKTLFGVCEHYRQVNAVEDYCRRRINQKTLDYLLFKDGER